MATSTLRYLDPSKLRVVASEDQMHPCVEIEGDRCILAARFKRTLPLTDPLRFISVQTSDEHEVGIIEDLEVVSEHDRQLILTALDRRYFTPVIEKIDDLRQDAGMWKFNVQTQRGAAEFYVRNWRDSAHESAPGRWQIHSVDGLRFEILGMEHLDERSQDLLEQLF